MSDSTSQGEHRLLPTVTVLILITLPLLLPQHVRTGFGWALGLAGLVLLAAVLFVDPGRVDRRGKMTRRLSVTLLLVLVASAMVATFSLVADLLDGSSEFDTAGTLLLTGLLVWLDANLTFSLLYWEMDGGGAAERLHNPDRYADLAFVEHVNPELAQSGWRPSMGDYLYLGYTNALAFSPTDVMPLTKRSKLAMAVQSMISLVILSLVIASAVNLLG